jgi:MFS family permease
MNGADFQISTVAEVIQLAVAPVFLLSGVGIMLTVLTGRLARVVERAREVEAMAKSATPTDYPTHQEQLQVLGRRARLMNRAITLCTICALLVAFVVVALFVGAFVEFNLATAIALMFIVAMLSFIAALLCFLREVFLAIASLRIGVKALK